MTGHIILIESCSPDSIFRQRENSTRMVIKSINIFLLLAVSFRKAGDAIVVMRQNAVELLDTFAP